MKSLSLPHTNSGMGSLQPQNRFDLFLADTMMLSGFRSLARRIPRARSVVSSSPALLSPPLRAFSSSSAVDDVDDFQIRPPEKLSFEMAEGIADATQFYIRYGVANQRLKALAADESLHAVIKWQKLMEIYLYAQVHVIGGRFYG